MTSIDLDATSSHRGGRIGSSSGCSLDAACSVSWDGAAHGRGCLAGPYPSGDGSWMSGLPVLNLVRQALASQTWTGSWTGLPDNPSAASAIYAMTGAIGAGSGVAAYSRASRNV
jgi:hypothetical protein